jgi:hypothetical protein
MFLWPLLGGASAGGWRILARSGGRSERHVWR